MNTLWVALQQCGHYPFLKMEKNTKETNLLVSTVAPTLSLFSVTL